MIILNLFKEFYDVLVLNLVNQFGIEVVMIERLDSELIRLLFQRFDGQDNVDVSDIVESEIFVDDNVLFRFQVDVLWYQKLMI